MVGSTDPGSFFTHEIGPPGNPGPGLQAAANWATRREGDISVVIMKVPRETMTVLEAAQSARTRSVPGFIHMPMETIFSPEAFDLLNKTATSTS